MILSANGQFDSKSTNGHTSYVITQSISFKMKIENTDKPKGLFY